MTARLRALATTLQELHDAVVQHGVVTEDAPDLAWRAAFDRLMAALARAKSELDITAAVREPDLPRGLTKLDIDIADVVACFTRWDANRSNNHLDADTICALRDLVKTWRDHVAPAPPGEARKEQE